MGKGTSLCQLQVPWGSLRRGAAWCPLLGEADLRALCHGSSGAGVSESWECWVEEEEEEEDWRGAWQREEGNSCGSPLGLRGHTKPEKLVLRSLEYGNFTCDRLWHTHQPEEEVF